jgi:hypothetical protein
VFFIKGKKETIDEIKEDIAKLKLEMEREKLKTDIDTLREKRRKPLFNLGKL